jgi:hypothetical protein
MGLMAGQDGAIDGYEPVPPPSVQPAGPPPRAATMFRRRSAQPSRRAVLHLRTSRDAPVPLELATWFTERGFHFYVGSLPGPVVPGRGWHRDGGSLTAAFAGLDAQREQMRSADGIDQVMVTAHGEGALAAALWCAGRPSGPAQGDTQPAGQDPAAAQRGSAGAGQPDRGAPKPGQPDRGGPERGRADALILYAPEFGRVLRRGLDISCPVLVIGGTGERPPLGAAARRRPALRRPELTAASQLGRHVTWLRPTDVEARPDARAAADRSRFFDEMGRWLGAYMYGQVRDRLL